MLKYLKSFLLLLLISLAFSSISQQLTSFYYPEENVSGGFRVEAMCTTSDSLYAAVIGGGENGLGYFFRIDRNGDGLNTIHSFNSAAYEPISLIGNDTVIFGTTRISENGGGKLFKYSLETHEFEFLHEFTNNEGGNIKIKYVTDSLIWGFSESETGEDEGSIFTIGLDGSGFNKIYNNTNETLGRQPSDIFIDQGYIFISFRSGGGIPYDDGGLVGSGSIVRLNLDGSNYLKLIEGSSSTGTDPRSIHGENGVLHVLFTRAGTEEMGRYVKIDYDGNNLESSLVLNGIGKGDITFDENILLLMSPGELVGQNIITEGSAELQSFSAEIGTDAVSGPIKFGDSYIISVETGGDSNLGGLLKWKNEKPTNPISLNTIFQEGFQSSTLNLLEYFQDDEEIISFYFEEVNGSVLATYDNTNLTLNITEQQLGITDASIKVTDSDLAELTIDFTLEVNGAPKLINPINIVTTLTGFGSLEIDINNKITDPEDDPLTYSFEVSNPNYLEVGIEGGIITVTESGPAEASTINLVVEDERGGVLNIPILEVDIPLGTNESHGYEIFPNPVSSILNLSSVPAGNVEIIGISGEVHFLEKIVEPSINVEYLQEGIYFIRINTKSRVLIERFVKKSK